MNVTGMRIRPPEPLKHVSSTEIRGLLPPTENAFRTIPMALRLPKRGRIQNATEALLNTMRESALFDGETLEQVRAQFSRVNVANSATAASDEDFTEMTEVLCDLIVNVIRPAMLEAAGYMHTQDRMLTFHDRAAEIVEICLPEGQDVEEVLQEYTERADQAMHALRDVNEAEMIADLYIHATDQVVGADEEAWARASDLFHKKKKTLLNQNRQRQEAAESVNRTLDALTDRVDRMGEQLVIHLVALKTEMETEHTSHQRMAGAALLLTGGGGT